MELTTYIFPELLVLIPVLSVLGAMLKRAQWLDDRRIPLTLGGCGMMLATVWACYRGGISAESLFAGITQGILCAGAGVYTHQIWKQSGKEK